MTDTIIFEHWDSFVQRVALRGRQAFEKAGITVEELGDVVRSMNSNRIRNAPLGIKDALFSVLGERFHREDFSGPALNDVALRRGNAIYAGFAYSLHLRQAELRPWLEAAVRLHLDRKQLLNFMLSSQFGIDAEDIQPHYGHTKEAFDDWLKVFPEDLFEKKG